MDRIKINGLVIAGIVEYLCKSYIISILLSRTITFYLNWPIKDDKRFFHTPWKRKLCLEQPEGTIFFSKKIIDLRTCLHLKISWLPYQCLAELSSDVLLLYLLNAKIPTFIDKRGKCHKFRVFALNILKIKILINSCLACSV